MHTARRFLVTIVVPALIVSIFAVGAAAAHGSDGKVTLCHFAANKFVKITVSLNAKPAHLEHGDVDPDEYGDCSGNHDGDHEGNHEGDHEGNHEGNQEGNEGGNDSSHCQGARGKTSHVEGSWSKSGGSNGNQHASVHSDKS